MTLPEFKAWFEGFTETMEGPPNEKQWARIQERIAEVAVLSPARMSNSAAISDWGQPFVTGCGNEQLSQSSYI